MSDSPTSLVREHIRRIAAEQGCETEPWSESILIRDGFYCGRRFELDGLHVVWFAEENELKVYEGDGSLLMVTAALSSEPALRRAA